MKTSALIKFQDHCLTLQDEIRRSGESRYVHRLHCVLLVTQGMTCAEVARLLGDSARSVQHWVQRFEKEGPVALAEADRSGRPARLNSFQLNVLSGVLRGPPSAVGLNYTIWNGKSVAMFIERRWKTQLGARQCQRLFRQLGTPAVPRRPKTGFIDLHSHANVGEDSAGFG